ASSAKAAEGLAGFVQVAQPVSNSTKVRPCRASQHPRLRRFAKISCLFEWLIGYHLYYAERNDTSHQSQVCSARTALGRTDTSPLGGCRSPSDRTRRDHLCCRGDWAVTDDHSCGLKRA